MSKKTTKHVNLASQPLDRVARWEACAQAKKPPWSLKYWLAEAADAMADAETEGAS